MNRDMGLGVEIFGLGLLMDQASKTIVAARLADGQSIRVIPRLLSIRPTHNAGGVYGLWDDIDRLYRVLLFLVLPLAMLLVLLLLVNGLKTLPRSVIVALALITSGAVGNLIDRALRGYVVDFLQVLRGRHDVGIYNFADLLIFAGIGVVLIVGVEKWLDERGRCSAVSVARDG